MLRESFLGPQGGFRRSGIGFVSPSRRGGYPAVNLEFLSDMKRRAAKTCVSRLQMAEAGARAGHPEEAIKYPEQAFELRDPPLVHMQRNPNLDSRRTGPS
jgi:hypothetical protein